MTATRPAKRRVALPAGNVLVRDVSGPHGAPTVVLLHGLGVTADINFYRCYRALGDRFRVLAFDHRGHGDGIRTRRPFRLADCADDVAAMADAVGVDRFVAVGYSMGGAVTQLLARRHPERLGGIVLCATAARFNDTPAEQVNFFGLGGLAAVARLTPPPVRRAVAERFWMRRRSGWSDWAIEQTSRSDLRAVLEAGAALGRFNAEGWLPDVDVPAAVVLTLGDSMVPVARQRRLAALLPGARLLAVDGDHDAVVAVPSFSATLIDAITSVSASTR